MLKKTLYFSLACLLLAASLQGCAQGAKSGAKLGFISNISVDAMCFDFDEAEWITADHTKRIEELGLSVENDMPSGFKIYNPAPDKTVYKVGRETTFGFLDWTDDPESKAGTFEAFAEFHDESDNASIPYWIEMENDVVISVKRQYLP